MEYIKDPMEIEKKSFEIITEELGEKTFPEREGKIIKRVIHTTADFQYGDITKINEYAIDSAIKALKEGCSIYTDTKMAMAGINKRVLKDLNSDIYCLVDDAEVSKEAKERGLTRSMVGMEKAVMDKRTKIFVIGNAPTALFQLCQFIDEGKVQPHLVVGVPVGFVGAKESKDELLKRKVPYITTVGRKGGSTVAAAIINALLYMTK
ncbi:precorrin-8X methylmutase [Clostridium formicaceticum]|uniref:Precorrin-8X methylmutase n=1 Tax=Clostridium formicaceticum TaxID=1497 RepID=A0AAC9RFH5_9CLOT|nr:precorrin-8X methylmutase [Clostridium formicaceticum]AOY75461.1 precorrin-8X methylmutase [Clostridium formicaceticum]ARE85746.1 Cobalt-precorrin-8X methylmutase [Clostridium formicaceticum]